MNDLDLVQELTSNTYEYPCPIDWYSPLKKYPEITYKDACIKLEKSNDPTIRSIGLWGLGRTYSDNRICVNGISLDKEQLFLNAINIDPTNSYAYYSLAEMMISDDKLIKLYNGCTFNRIELCVKAIELCPKNCKPYHDLAIKTKKFPIALNDSRQFTKIQLLLESLKYTQCSYTYSALAFQIESTINVNGKIFNREQLFIEAQKLDIYNPNAYYGLAYIILDSDVTKRIKLYDGRELNKCDLLIHIIKWGHRRSDILIVKKHIKQLNKYWNRDIHMLEIYDQKVNILFATLFLSIQKFESMGCLSLAHQAIFEDMLEFYQVN